MLKEISLEDAAGLEPLAHAVLARTRALGVDAVGHPAERALGERVIEVMLLELRPRGIVHAHAGTSAGLRRSLVRDAAVHAGVAAGIGPLGALVPAEGVLGKVVATLAALALHGELAIRDDRPWPRLLGSETRRGRVQ